MGNVIVHKSISLDGYVAGPNVSMENPMGEGGEALHSWMFGAPAPIDQEVAAWMTASAGAVVCGRHTFELGLPHWEDTPYPAPTFVLTRTGRPPLPARSASFTFVTDVAAAVRQAVEVAGGRDVIVMGAETSRAVLRAGLLDRVQLNLVPLLLGAGARLFDGVSVALEQEFSVSSPAVTHVRYRVVPS
ncbi:dihydrofolate reductase [Lentzea atacamensis]|uniref:Dihydrofolate reductase n=1 Tax=Lentzea atacamensis TaxID=531938 RepID=A0A316HLG3_9PSEU|nr:dihydrofolate reductase family protein [Lentzea atacamensis]PWK80811.1 dihydrofolate reductase [Lentzea atacamensis]